MNKLMNLKTSIPLLACILTTSLCLYASEDSIRLTSQFEQIYTYCTRNHESYQSQLQQIKDLMQDNLSSLSEHDKLIFEAMKRPLDNLKRTNNHRNAGHYIMMRVDSKKIDQSNELINSLVAKTACFENSRQRALQLQEIAIHNVELDKYGNRHHK